MTRNRASAKQAGTRMETSTAEYFAAHLDERIERRRLTGAKDRGDLTSIPTLRGSKLVVEVKDHNGSVQVKPWLDEAEVEAGNDDAPFGVVVFKRSRIGYTDAAHHGVLMTLETLVWLLQGAPEPDDLLIRDKATITDLSGVSA